jgi:hypothetical protein
MRTSIELYFLVVVLFLTNLFFLTFLNSSSVSAKTVSEQPVLTGEVVNKSDTSLTLKNKDEMMVVEVADNTPLQKNWRETSVSNINVGDRVSIQQDAQGEIVSVSAISKWLIDFGDWVLPAAGLALVASIFLTALGRRLRHSLGREEQLQYV